MTKSFDEWLDTTKLRGYMDENSLEAAWEAGQQSKQAEVDELQLKLSEDSRVLHNVIDIERKKCEELQNKYDAMYRAFTVADDCRKEWHHCYMGARQREDELQKRIDEAIKELECIHFYKTQNSNNAIKILKGDQL